MHRRRFLAALGGSASLGLGGPSPTARAGRERYLSPLTERRSSSMWPTISSHHGREGEQLGGGQRQRMEYAIGGDAVGVTPGEYVVEGSIGIGGSYRGGTSPFRVVLKIE